MEDVINREKYAYERKRVIDPETGKPSVRTGNKDAIANAMMSVATDGVEKVAKANGLHDRFKEKWKALNAGMQRMALGNALRTLIRAGQEVTIGEHVIRSLGQKVIVEAAPKVEAKAPADKAAKTAAKKAPARRK